MYKSGEEYNIRYYSKDGKEQTCTITPEEDMNRPQVIRKLKEEHKDFLKLIECKLVEGDSNMEYKTYKDLVEDGRAADVCDNIYDIWVYVDYDPDSEDYFDLCLEQICSELEIKDADVDYTTVTCNVTDWVRNHLNKLEEIFAIDAPDEDAKVEEFVCEMFEGLVSGNGTDKAYEQLYYALIDAPIPYTKQPEVKPENIHDHSIKKEEVKIEDPMEDLTESLVEEIVEEAKEKKLIKKYQIALSSYDGISPQKYEIFDDKEEAEEIADSYNKSNSLGQYGNPNAEWVVIEKEVYTEEEIALSESYFNLYNAMNDLYSIDKYSPKELINFLNGLKEQERISDKDYNLLTDYANEHQALIDKCGYESKVLDEAIEEEIVETISKERKAEIIAELFDWIDYHGLDAYEFLNVTDEDLEKSAKSELDEEKMNDIISKGIACVSEHVDGNEELKIAFKDVIGLNDNEIKELEIDIEPQEIIEEAKEAIIDLTLKIKPWYHEAYPTDDIYTELRDEVTFQDVQDTLDKGEDVYETFGVGDSIVRERVFEKLAELRNVEYDVIYNQWLHTGDEPDEEEMEALKQVFNTLMNSKKEEAKLVEDETTPEELEQFANDVDEAIEEVGPVDESEELAVNVVNDSVDVLEVDERMAINGYEDFLNAAKELLAPALYEVLEKEIKEIIADEEDHITKLENIKAVFHLEDLELPIIVPEELIQNETEESVKAEEEIIEESKSKVTLNDVLDELECDIDSPMAQEEGPMIQEFIDSHPELTAIQIAEAYRNYEETGIFE